MFLPAHNEEATVADVVRRAPADVARAPGRGRGRRRRLDRRHRRPRPGMPGADRPLARQQPGARRGRARRGCGSASSAARRRSRSSTPTASTRPTSSPPSSVPILQGRADYVVGSRFAGLPRAMRPHRWFGNRVLTAGVQPARAALGRADAHRRPVRLPGAVGRRRRPRRGDPRLQLRPGAHPRPAGQGVPLRRGADQLPVPRARRVVHPARALPAPGGARRSGRELRSPADRHGRSVLDHEAAEAVAGGPPATGVEGAVGI